MIKQFIRAGIIAAGLCGVPGIATADIFMHIARAPGDATAKGHENWIRVTSADWNLEAASSWTAGSGASVGKPKPGEIQLVLPTGSWSAHFLKMIVGGKAEPKIILDAVASDGRPLYRLTLEGVFLTQYRLATLPATPLPQDHVDGVYKIARFEFYSISADGRVLVTPVVWDVVAQTVTPGL